MFLLYLAGLLLTLGAISIPPSGFRIVRRRDICAAANCTDQDCPNIICEGNPPCMATNFEASPAQTALRQAAKTSPSTPTPTPCGSPTLTSNSPNPVTASPRFVAGPSASISSPSNHPSPTAQCTACVPLSLN